jgi:hypothetical protein
MFVFGGKTVYIKATRIPLRSESSRSRTPRGNRFYTAVEEICGLESLSVFDLGSQRWTSVLTSGAIPPPRYGHCGTVVDGKYYLYGGKGETQTFSDLYVLDLETLVWDEILPFGEMAPPALDLASMEKVHVDGVPTLILAGGRVDLHSSSDGGEPPKAHRHAKSNFAMYMFSITTSFWRVIPFACAAGERRISCCICDVTPKRPTTSSASLRRLPFESAPVLKLLLMGGERGIPHLSLDESADLDEGGKARLDSIRDEASLLSAQSVHPRPSEKHCIVNLAHDTQEKPVQLSVGATLHASRIGSANEKREMSETSRLNLTSATRPGWFIHKTSARLSTAVKPPAPQPTKDKNQRKLTAAETEHSLNRIFYKDMTQRQQNREQMTKQRDASEAKLQTVYPEVEDWGQHFSRVFYAASKKYADARDPALRDKDRPPSRRLNRDEQERANQQLYYKSVQEKKESMIKLVDSVLSPKRPQSASVSRERIASAVDRLHRGPPSPLSSQKFGPKGTRFPTK